MAARLSVNINKFALLRNSRGHDNPNVLRVARDAEQFGAQGITVHPRPDERHVRYDDVRALRSRISTELNIEGNPREARFVELVREVQPAQVTLVPDAQGQLTSDHGWDTILHETYLRDLISVFRGAGIRTSIFVDPDPRFIEGAARAGTDRIELHTAAYAAGYSHDRDRVIAPYIAAARRARELGLGLNAGHDLDLVNLRFFADNVPDLLEVSIGHALVCDALYLGLDATIRRYLGELTATA